MINYYYIDFLAIKKNSYFQNNYCLIFCHEKIDLGNEFIIFLHIYFNLLESYYV